MFFGLLENEINMVFIGRLYVILLSILSLTLSCYSMVDTACFSEKSIVLPIGDIPFTKNMFIENVGAGSKKSYLKKLDENFNLVEQGMVILSGMGGIGKTVLATQYMFKSISAKRYDFILWITADTEQKMLAGYKGLLRKIEVPYEENMGMEGIFQLVNDYFSKWGLFCLFIYDNVPNPCFLKGKIPSNSQGHVLVTSRRKDWKDNANIIEMDTFQSSDGVNFLFQNTGITRDERSKQGAEILVEKLGGLPLALVHVVGYIEYKRRIKEYGFWDWIDEFEKYSLDLFKKNRRYSGTCATIDCTYFLESNDDFISELEKKILHYCAEIALDDIPIEFFNNLHSDKSEVECAVANLIACSLLKITEHKKVSLIHPLIKKVLKNSVF
jgi:hypothetical protein